MSKPMTSRYAIAGAAILLTLAGCGTSGADSTTDEPTATATAAPARDKGPACVGEATADGVHVLRGGGFRLPDGGVQYAAATADGTTRTATLRDGAKYEDGQKQQTVKPGQKITVAGHAYTVSQICSYRVVLEPQDAKDKATLAAAPKSLESQGGEADNGLCFTTNASVLATAAKGFPAKGSTLSVLDNSGVKVFPTGLSLTVYVSSGAELAGINGSCAGIQVAGYENVRVGDPVEFAGVQFKVSELKDNVVRMTRTSE